MEQFKNKRDLAKKQEGSWYLGKHLGQASRSATKIAKTVWGG